MTKIIATLGSFVGGSIGWWMGAGVGTMTAFILSIIGTGVGIYFGRQLALKLEM